MRLTLYSLDDLKGEIKFKTNVPLFPSYARYDSWYNFWKYWVVEKFDYLYFSDFTDLDEEPDEHYIAFGHEIEDLIYKFLLFELDIEKLLLPTDYLKEKIDEEVYQVALEQGFYEDMTDFVVPEKYVRCYDIVESWKEYIEDCDKFNFYYLFQGQDFPSDIYHLMLCEINEDNLKEFYKNYTEFVKSYNEFEGERDIQLIYKLLKFVREHKDTRFVVVYE